MRSGLDLVTTREMIECAIEKLADLVVEFLDAVQLERKELFGRDPIAGKVREAVLADISAQVVLGDQMRVSL